MSLSKFKIVPIRNDSKIQSVDGLTFSLENNQKNRALILIDRNRATVVASEDNDDDAGIL